MPNSPKPCRKHRRRIRFCVSTLVSLALAGVILWALVAFHEPQAKLHKLNLRQINESYSKIYLEMELTNKNYFRGFNHSGGGWVEVFYMSETGVSSNDRWSLNYDWTPSEYQGRRKSLNWNFTFEITPRKLAWKTYTPLLKNKDSHIYVSVYLPYLYNILFWTSEKTYYQWLDANVYLNGSFDLFKVSDFNRTKNFDLAF